MDKIKHQTIHTNGINLHVATLGEGEPILFLHGFPELWYSWRHQMLSLSSLGYRTIAPDLRGYGDSDIPNSPDQYTMLHVVGDLIGVLDALEVDKVFLVAHDWGAIVAWHFCLFRPDRVKALVNTSVCFRRLFMDQEKPVEMFRSCYGDDYYICRFQEIGFGIPPEYPLPLPSWLTKEDVKYCASKFDKSGFTAALNYYRCLDLNWELTAAWNVDRIKVPVKFIIGDLDMTYHMPGIKEYIHGEGFKRDVPFLHEVVVMKGVAHFLNQEKPDEISNHIYDFIKKF